MNHIMTDLETLGVKQTSAFVSIGAVKFNPYTGKLGDTYYQNIDWTDALKTRAVDADTIKWWMRQSKEAQNAVCAAGKPLKTVLSEFAKWFRKEDDEGIIWGNGATFDVSLLENAYGRFFGVNPWKFWNVRDVRTIVDLAKGKVEKPKMQGTAHNALDDAIHQAKFVSQMWQALKRK